MRAPTVLDRWKRSVEKLLDIQFDWRPFSPPVTPCLPGNTRISWKVNQYIILQMGIYLAFADYDSFHKYCEEELNVDVALPMANLYKAKCIPLSGTHQRPIRFQMEDINSLGQSTESRSFQPQEAAAQGPPRDLPTNSANKVASGTTPQTRNSPLKNRFLEVYWCIDKPWSERRITIFCGLSINDSTTDAQFGKELLEKYNAVRGFRGRWISWKTCVDVKFINVSVPTLTYEARSY